MATMWMVRAGEGGSQFAEFHDGSYVAIGWNELGDLTNVTSQDDIRTKYEAVYPDEHPSKVANAVAMIYKFRSVLTDGQQVITYDPVAREYLVGSVNGDYQFEQSKPSCHVRSVEWSGKVDRDTLSIGTRNALGSSLTVFQVNDEARSDILKALKGEKAGTESEAKEKEELEQIKEDTIEQAHELIKDRILKLDDAEVEQLVASILRAMGYRARVSLKGPDRGVDVFASPDGLGFEEPRIKAEVKHRPKTQMGSQEIRSFLGALRQGDRGLYVSTGGFSKEAGYEAERATIPITLVALDELASLVVTHYESFDMDGKILLPLTRLYWPSE